ncbi:MAG: hypothetical protein NTX15_06450 [Candidatus Kapabacteria bacterium]|nr:hypothetical protein [Candidatus Kapabacteria bacterium]
MNSLYSPEKFFARLGSEIAEASIASVNCEIDRQKRIDILEGFIRQAERNMPLELAEWIYEYVLTSQPLSEIQTQANIDRADALRMPHRISDMFSPDLSAPIEDLHIEPLEQGASVLEDEGPLRATLLFWTAIEFILRHDDEIGPIMQKATDLQIEFSRKTRWGRAIVKKMDLIDATLPTDANHEDLLSSQWWDLEFQLRRELFKHKIPPTQFLSDEDAQTISKRTESVSVFEILYHLQLNLTHVEFVGMMIDSGTCELNSRVYVHRVREEVDLIKSQLGNTPSFDVGQREKRALSMELFAELLFESLSSNHLLGHCALADIKSICQHADTRKGALRLKIPKGDVIWCARIVYAIANRLGRAHPLFKVFNGKKLLKAAAMHHALHRRRKVEPVCPQNVAAFFERIANVTIESGVEPQ